MSELKHQEEGAKGEFQLIVEGDIVANMVYSRIDPNNIIVSHTAVHPQHKGKGMGKQIVAEVVQWCRDNDQKVLPICPYTKSIIDRNPELQDILRK